MVEETIILILLRICRKEADPPPVGGDDGGCVISVRGRMARNEMGAQR